MPRHINIQFGDCRKALHTNVKVRVTEDKYHYVREEGEKFDSLYHISYYHFLIYGARLAGHSRTYGVESPP